MERRVFIKSLLLATGALILAKYAALAAAIETLQLSDEAWKKRLSAQQYDILRREGTEHPFTSPLNDEHRDGMFACAGCGRALFPSTFKFDSGTGWPSFFDCLPGHLETKTDYAMLIPRTEYHCAKCGGHHGHVFDDGPKPTGLRYCNNGAVLNFIPA